MDFYLADKNLTFLQLNSSCYLASLWIRWWCLRTVRAILGGPYTELSYLPYQGLQTTYTLSSLNRVGDLARNDIRLACPEECCQETLIKAMLLSCIWFSIRLECHEAVQIHFIKRQTHW
jgi:hypothetical protein